MHKYDWDKSSSSTSAANIAKATICHIHVMKYAAVWQIALCSTARLLLELFTFMLEDADKNCIENRLDNPRLVWDCCWAATIGFSDPAPNLDLSSPPIRRTTHAGVFVFGHRLRYRCCQPKMLKPMLVSLSPHLSFWCSVVKALLSIISRNKTFVTSRTLMKALLLIWERKWLAQLTMYYILNPQFSPNQPSNIILRILSTP